MAGEETRRPNILCIVTDQQRADHLGCYGHDRATTPTLDSIAAEGVQVEVTDTGEGISADDLPRIFERFYRVDRSRSRELGGTGLGLSIVKHLVEGMGGEVSVASTPGQGTRFAFTLPRPAPGPGAARGARPGR